MRQEKREKGIKITDYIRLFPKQKEVLPYIGKGYRIFFGGARGGGKSHCALAIAILACIQFPGLRVGIIRRYFGELEENFISKLVDLYPSHIFGYKYNKQAKTAVFNNRSRIIFRPAEREMDLEKVLGLEYHMIIVDEANQFTQKSIERMIGSLRNSSVKNFAPTLFMTGNPGGMSDVYFKTRFVNPNYQYWSPHELLAKDKYIYISSTVYDNPIIMENDPGYIENLKTLDDARRRAWLDGDWEIFEGQFFTEWNESVHVVQPFEIPENWYKFAGLDLGGSREHPTVMLKLAQDPDTLTVYVYDETTIIGSVEVMIEEIKAFQEKNPAQIIFADPDMWKQKIKSRESDNTPGIMMTNEGLPVVPADNTRITGWYVVKSWMHWTQNRPPKVKIFANCSETIRTIPLMLFNTKAGSSLDMMDMTHDDYADALRYALVSGVQYPTSYEIITTQEKASAQKQEEDNSGRIPEEFFDYNYSDSKPHFFNGTIKYNSKKRSLIWV